MKHGRWGYLKHKCRCDICTQAELDYQDSKRHTITCPECGTVAEVARRSRFCSSGCATAAGNKTNPNRACWTPQAPTLVQCGWCNGLHTSGNKYCGADCREAAATHRARASRSPLRAALQDYDIATVRHELLMQATVVDDCWIWPKLDKDGYPQVTTQDRALHRQVLEAKFGQKLGSQQAHHICSTSACVNPDHLQPVTHRENIAEMLARRSYVARIRELEEVIAVELGLDHPSLQVIAVA